MMVMYPAVRIRARRELRLETLVGLAIVKPGDAHQLRGLALPCFRPRCLDLLFLKLPGFELRQHLRQLPVRRRPGNQRNMRRPLKNLFAFLLCHASQDAKRLALRLQLLVVGQPVKNFLLRLIANRAGVVKDQVRLLDRLHLPVPFLHQRANDFFRVMHIHLAPKRLQIKCLPRI